MQFYRPVEPLHLNKIFLRCMEYVFSIALQGTGKPAVGEISDCGRFVFKDNRYFRKRIVN